MYKTVLGRSGCHQALRNVRGCNESLHLKQPFCPRLEYPRLEVGLSSCERDEATVVRT